MSRPTSRSGAGLRALAVLACIGAFASPAAAAFDPDRASEDALSARQGHDAFCKKPVEPLGHGARALCPLAGRIDDCARLVQACAKASEVAEKPREREAPAEISPAWSSLARALLWALVVAAVIALVVPVWRAFKARRDDAAVTDPTTEPTEPRAKPELPAEEPPLTDAEALFARADRLAGTGDYARALSTYLHAAIAGLDARGVLQVGAHRTNGEYVRACQSPEARAGLRDLVREVDAVEYGGAAATREAVTRAAQRAHALARGVTMMLGALLCAFLLAGCGGGDGRLDDDRDPASLSMLTRLLRKQGVEVTTSGPPLASLKLGDPSDRSRLLVVFADRVLLDEEGSRHLVKWVRRGGRLALIGGPARWPKPLDIDETSAPGDELTVNDPRDEEVRSFTAHRAHHGAIRWQGSDPLAITDGGAMVAAIGEDGEGLVLAVADEDLFTNAGLSVEGNAPATIAMLAAFENRDRENFHAIREVRIVGRGEGVTPAGNPFAAMRAAGFGPALGHFAVAGLLLFVAYGVRQTRATPTAPRRRRAFIEHIAANGVLWSRAGLAQRALAAYVQWVELRVRARMPRGAGEPATYLAQRAGADPAEVEEIFRQARAAETERGQALASLRRIRSLFAAAQLSS
jgi:hypothetical protein